MNYGELKEAAKNYLECDEQTFNDNFPLFVQLAEEEIYRQIQLPFLKKTEVSIPMTATVRTLEMPSDLLSVYSFAYINSSNEYVFLLEKEDDFLREAYPSNLPGSPRYYAWKDENDLLIAPTPDDNYATEIVYFYKPVSLSENSVPSNTNWLSENGENALLFGSILQGYVYLKGDQDVVTLYKEKFDNAVADLKVISEGRQRKDTYRTMDRRIPT